MFDNINRKTKEKIEIEQKKGRNINLLPDNLRYKDKKEIKDNLNFIKHKKNKIDWHTPVVKYNGKDKSKQINKIKKFKPNKKKIFSLKFLLSKFKLRKNKSKQESVLAVNISGKKEKSKVFAQKSKMKNKKENKITNKANTDEIKKTTNHLKYNSDNKEVIIPEKKEFDNDEIKFHIVKEKFLKDKKVEDKKEEMEVNFLPSEKTFISFRRAIISYLLVLIVCILVISLSFLFFREKNIEYNIRNKLFTEQLKLVNKKISQKQIQIDDFGNIAYKLKYLNQLLEKHVYWSNFFPTLEAHTIPNIYFTELTASSDFAIHLQAVALDLHAVAEELMALKNSAIYINSSLDNLRLNREKAQKEEKNGIGFSIFFNLDPAVISADNSQLNGNN